MFDAKHESQLMYEGETLSYDPAVYGGAFEARARIKTLKVCAGASCCVPGVAPGRPNHVGCAQTRQAPRRLNYAARAQMYNP